MPKLIKIGYTGTVYTYTIISNNYLCFKFFFTALPVPVLFLLCAKMQVLTISTHRLLLFPAPGDGVPIIPDPATNNKKKLIPVIKQKEESTNYLPFSISQYCPTNTTVQNPQA